MPGDYRANQVEVIYGGPDQVCPLEYVVWAVKYDTEIGRIGPLSDKPKVDFSGLKSPEAHYFYKMKNSKWIKKTATIRSSNKSVFRPRYILCM